MLSCFHLAARSWRTQPSTLHPLWLLVRFNAEAGDHVKARLRGLRVVADRGCGVGGRGDVRFRAPERASRNTGPQGGDFAEKHFQATWETLPETIDLS